MGCSRPIPHLNVRSKNLVYLSEVSPNINGKEIKRRLINQFGPIRFVETFEAWKGIGILTGDMIIEFGHHGDSIRFVSGVKNDNVSYLKTSGVQHIENAGSRRFFQLVHKNTGIDLLCTDGKPVSMEWTRTRSHSQTSTHSRRWRSRSPSRVIPIGVESTWQNRQRNRIRNRDLFWTPSLMKKQTRWDSRSRSRSRYRSHNADTNTSIFSRVTWLSPRNQLHFPPSEVIHLVENNKSGTSSSVNLTDDDEGTSGSGPSCHSSTSTRGSTIARSRHHSKRTVSTNDLEEGEIVDSDSHEEEGDAMSLEGAGDPMDVEGTEKKDEEEEEEIEDDIELLSGDEEDDRQEAVPPIATGQKNENVNEEIDDIISGESIVDQEQLVDSLIDDEQEGTSKLVATHGNGHWKNHEQGNEKESDDDEIVFLGQHIGHLSIDKSLESNIALKGVQIKQESTGMPVENPM